MSGGPHGLFTIAPGRAFLGDLAAGIVSRFGAPGEPLALAGVTVFLPTRRAARTLAERRADWKQNFQQLLRAYDLARELEGRKSIEH